MNIVGHKLIAEHLIEHGMPAGFHMKHRFIANLRADIPMLDRVPGEAAKHIELGHELAERMECVQVLLGLFTKLIKQGLFACDAARLGREDFALEIL